MRWLRIQIGPQFMAGDAGSAFHIENTKRRDAIPLRQRLRGHANSGGKLVAGADCFDGSLKGVVFVAHAESKAILETKSQAALSLLHKAPLYPVEMSFKDRLKEARKAVGMTQAELAEPFDLSPQAVSGWERGEAMPEPEKLPELARQLRTSVDWLLEKGPGDLSSEDVAASIGTRKRRLDVKGYVGAGGKTHFYDVDAGALERIEAQASDPPNAVALTVRGTSLGRFFDRWYAIYNDVRSPVTDDLIGEICVVETDDGRMLIKVIRRNGAKFDLLSNNEKDPPMKKVGIKWAAKVIDVRRK